MPPGYFPLKATHQGLQSPSPAEPPQGDSPWPTWSPGQTSGRHAQPSLPCSCPACQCLVSLNPFGPPVPPPGSSPSSGLLASSSSSTGSAGSHYTQSGPCSMPTQSAPWLPAPFTGCQSLGPSVALTTFSASSANSPDMPGSLYWLLPLPLTP